jgi:hypothetical protein
MMATSSPLCAVGLVAALGLKPPAASIEAGSRRIDRQFVKNPLTFAMMTRMSTPEMVLVTRSIGVGILRLGEIFSRSPSTLMSAYGMQRVPRLLHIAEGVGSLLGGPMAARRE